MKWRGGTASIYDIEDEAEREAAEAAERAKQERQAKRDAEILTGLILDGEKSPESVQDVCLILDHLNFVRPPTEDETYKLLGALQQGSLHISRDRDGKATLSGEPVRLRVQAHLPSAESTAAEETGVEDENDAGRRVVLCSTYRVSSEGVWTSSVDFLWGFRRTREMTVETAVRSVGSCFGIPEMRQDVSSMRDLEVVRGAEYCPPFVTETQTHEIDVQVTCGLEAGLDSVRLPGGASFSLPEESRGLLVWEWLMDDDPRISDSGDDGGANQWLSSEGAAEGPTEEDRQTVRSLVGAQMRRPSITEYQVYCSTVPDSLLHFVRQTWGPCLIEEIRQPRDSRSGVYVVSANWNNCLVLWGREPDMEAEAQGAQTLRALTPDNTVRFTNTDLNSLIYDLPGACWHQPQFFGKSGTVTTLGVQVRMGLSRFQVGRSGLGRLRAIWESLVGSGGALQRWAGGAKGRVFQDLLSVYSFVDQVQASSTTPGATNFFAARVEGKEQLFVTSMLGGLEEYAEEIRRLTEQIRNLHYDRSLWLPKVATAHGQLCIDSICVDAQDQAWVLDCSAAETAGVAFDDFSSLLMSVILDGCELPTPVGEVLSMLPEEGAPDTFARWYSIPRPVAAALIQALTTWRSSAGSAMQLERTLARITEAMMREAHRPSVSRRLRELLVAAPDDARILAEEAQFFAKEWCAAIAQGIVEFPMTPPPRLTSKVFRRLWLIQYMLINIHGQWWVRELSAAQRKSTETSKAVLPVDVSPLMLLVPAALHCMRRANQHDLRPAQRCLAGVFVREILTAISELGPGMAAFSSFRAEAGKLVRESVEVTIPLLATLQSKVDQADARRHYAFILMSRYATEVDPITGSYHDVLTQRVELLANGTGAPKSAHECVYTPLLDVDPDEMVEPGTNPVRPAFLVTGSTCSGKTVLLKQFAIACLKLRSTELVPVMVDAASLVGVLEFMNTQPASPDRTPKRRQEHQNQRRSTRRRRVTCDPGQTTGEPEDTLGFFISQHFGQDSLVTRYLTAAKRAKQCVFLFDSVDSKTLGAHLPEVLSVIAGAREEGFRVLMTAAELPTNFEPIQHYQLAPLSPTMQRSLAQERLGSARLMEAFLRGRWLGAFPFEAAAAPFSFLMLLAAWPGEALDETGDGFLWRALECMVEKVLVRLVVDHLGHLADTQVVIDAIEGLLERTATPAQLNRSTVLDFAGVERKMMKRAAHHECHPVQISAEEGRMKFTTSQRTWKALGALGHRSLWEHLRPLILQGAVPFLRPVGWNCSSVRFAHPALQEYYFNRSALRTWEEEGKSILPSLWTWLEDPWWSGARDMFLAGAPSAATQVTAAVLPVDHSLTWPSLTETGALAVGVVLRHTRAVKVLDIPDLEEAADAESATRIALALSRGFMAAHGMVCSLCVLRMHCWLDSAALRALAPGMRELKQLEELNLSNNPRMGPTGAEVLQTSILPHLSRLVQLNLRQCGLLSQGAQHIAQGLKGLRKLETLNLERNNFEDSGAEALARVLPSLTALRHFRFFGNGMTGDAMKALVPWPG